MTNREQIYEICLEDYTQPRYKSDIRSYYGTQDDMIGLSDRLKTIEGANIRYEETIESVEYYDVNHDAIHAVAGQVMPVLKPVAEVVRISAHLEGQCWKYTTHDGAVFPCYASQIDACQSLISTDTGYERCLKVTFHNLAISFPGAGWVSFRRNFKGFPGMVVTDGDKVSLALFVSQAHYEPDEYDVAAADAMDFGKIDLSVAVGDILGEG